MDENNTNNNSSSAAEVDSNAATNGQAPVLSILKMQTPADGECELCEKGVPNHHHDIVVDDPTATEVDLTHCRVGRIANLEKCTLVEVLCLRWNMIVKIENLDALENLRELDFYDNQIVKIENLDTLKKLEMLDLSFNRITKIENLSSLGGSLKKLFFVENRLNRIENLDSLAKLELLELGSNKLQKLEGLDNLVELRELYLGRNRIRSIDTSFASLRNLRILSLASNRLTRIEGLNNLVALEQLYLSSNMIEKIEGLESNHVLNTLDLAENKIDRIENIGHLSKLEEFWFNSNKLSRWSDVEVLASLPNLKTVYLEHNPIYFAGGQQDGEPDANYRRRVILALPQITQLDATCCRASEPTPPPIIRQSSQQEIIRVSELVELLADSLTSLDVKIQAAVMLQHLTYLDPFVKAEVASFNVAHHLIALLAAHHRNPQIPRIFALSVLGALRNLCSGADSTARRAVTSADGKNLAVLLDVIGAHQAIEAEETAVRELSTAVLWNISVDGEIVTRLTEEGVLDVISRVILLPSIQFATKTPYNSTHSWVGWCTDFKNASGILRNSTAQLDHAVALVNGKSGIAPLRLLLENFTLAVRFSVTQQDTESKAVENIVCFLQNITAAISAEATRNAKMKRATSTPNVTNNNQGQDSDVQDQAQPSSFGCAIVGSQWCLSRQNNRTATLMAAGRAGGGERRGQNDPNEKQLISVACARSLVEAILPLLADCSNPTTLEAGLGTIRNIVSIPATPLKLRDLKSSQQALIAEPGCCDVARDGVWRHGGLPIIVDLLAITSDGVLRAAASALAALGTSAIGAADTDGVLVIRELIGKQALDRLVRKVPTPADAALTDSFASDAAICSILAAILVIIRPFSQQQQAAFHQQIMTPSSPAAFSLHAVSDLGLVSRMLFLVRPERFGFTQVQFDPQVKRLAMAVLATLWQHTELRPAYSRLGIDRAAFFPSLGPHFISSNVSLSQQHQQQQQQRMMMMTPGGGVVVGGVNSGGAAQMMMMMSGGGGGGPGEGVLQFSQQQYMYPNGGGPDNNNNCYPGGESYSKSCQNNNGIYNNNVGFGYNTANNDYMVVEERLVGGHPSATNANNESTARSAGAHQNGSAARIETRRGSSSSSWDTNNNSAGGNNNSVIIQGPMLASAGASSGAGQHDSLSSLIAAASGSNNVTEPAIANNRPEDMAAEDIMANNQQTGGGGGNFHELDNNNNNDDDEMFALSQLGPGMVVDELMMATNDDGNNINNQGQEFEGGPGGGVGEEEEEYNNYPLQDATNNENEQVISPRSSSINRDLFMLALNSNAPDSWV